MENPVKSLGYQVGTLLMKLVLVCLGQSDGPGARMRGRRPALIGPLSNALEPDKLIS